jgi:hypothetical protein
MAMSLLTGTTAVWHRFILALLIVAMLGPWTFDLLHVPAQYACDEPSVRLYGDFCGYPLSGFGAFVWIFSGFFSMPSELVQGNLTSPLPGFITLLFMGIIVFPFLSTFLLLRQNTWRRLQILNLTAWVLACLATLTLFVLQFNREQFVQFYYLLWGLLIYILVAIGTVIFEILVIRSKSSPSRTQ